MKKTILITGSHRSGTTWVGNILTAASKTANIHEPFNINPMLFNPCSFEHWFQYIDESNEDTYYEKVRDVITYQYLLASALTKVGSARDVLKVFRSYVRSLYFKLNGYDPIIKDPIAFFSASWLAERFDMNVLVMLRHPAAFCSSLKLKDWRFDFSSFLNQPLLMEQYLQRFDADIREYAANEKDIISQAALLWNCIYHTVGVYQEKHPEWMFVRHEDLSKDPVAQFQKICQPFDVKFTDKMQTLILDSSGAHNPKEQQPNNEFIRDSKGNITNWKERLSKAEIQFIKEKTKDVSKAFYTESDW